MGEIIDGRAISGEVKRRVKKEVEILKKQGIDVCLSVVLVGDDPASKVYVNSKKKACSELGIESREILLEKDVSQEKLMSVIEELNEDSKVNGILVQLPLPKHLDEFLVIDKISHLKDVDCFNVKNVGALVTGKFNFSPCTPAGIVDLIKSTNIAIEGKNCVVVGRSNIVGKPMAILMLQQNATVTVVHSRTKNLDFFTKNADILIVAIGRPNFITKEMVKKGAVVIDVGINRLSDGKLCGDVDFLNVSKVASFITPVPGGVGPMTIAKLMENTVVAAKIQNKILS